MFQSGCLNSYLASAWEFWPRLLNRPFGNADPEVVQRNTGPLRDTGKGVQEFPDMESGTGTEPDMELNVERIDLPCCDSRKEMAKKFSQNATRPTLESITGMAERETMYTLVYLEAEPFDVMVTNHLAEVQTSDDRSRGYSPSWMNFRSRNANAYWASGLDTRRKA